MNKYDINIMNYRQRHKRCRYCKYREYITKAFLCSVSCNKCVLKDKYININIWPLRGCMCQWYRAKDVIEN